MAQNTNWQSIFDAIASAQLRQVYRGYHGRAHHWSLEGSLPAEQAEQIVAYMEEHGAPASYFQTMLRAGFTKAGAKWKFNHKVLPLLVMFGGLGLAAMIGGLLDTNVCLGFLIVYIILALWFLKGFHHRRMKSIWNDEGSISSRLDKMCALSAQSPLRAILVPLLVILVLSLPLVVGTADPKLYPYMQANSMFQSGEYEDAEEAFAKLGDYKDAPDRLIETKKAIADEYMGKDWPSKALDYYREIGYEPGMAAAHYRLGELYQGKYDDPDRAMSHYQHAGDYLDAKVRAGELAYAKAEAMLAEGDESGAIEYFTAAGEYSDAMERISIIYRGHADEYLAAGEEELAAQQFALAGDTQRADEIYSRLIDDALAAHDYISAARLYTAQGDEAAAQRMRYLEGVWHYDKGNYPYAYLCFSAMADYVPAEGRTPAEYLQDEAVIAGSQDTQWYVPGNIVTFGTYPQDTDPFTGAEPLEWVVLDCDGDYSLIMTRYVIDHAHNDLRQRHWVDSPSREWLNSDFIERAFWPEEREAIRVTKVHNGPETSHPAYGRSGGETTEDRVFLLSYQQAIQYFGTKNHKQVATAYAQKQGVDFSFDGSVSLLRSVAYSSHDEKEVSMAFNFSGQLAQYNGRPDATDTGLQPAMWVSLDAVRNLQ